MGWATELQQASFRGVLFECVSTNDSTSKALAVQQSPYSNDAIIEDMGNDAEKISLRIFLSGDDYLVYLAALKTAFAYSGMGELVHPIYGIKNVNVQNWNVVHNTETVDGCDIDVDFLVAKAERKQLFIPTQIVEIEPKNILSFPAKVFQAELEQLKEKDPNQFFKVINRIRNGLQTARKILGITRSTIDNILSPPTWATGLVDDIVRIANFDADISAVAKWRSLFDRVKRVNKIFDNDDQDDSPAFKQLWRAVSVASTVAIAQVIVKRTRSNLAKNQSTTAFKQVETITSKQQSSSSNFVMTPIDLAVIRQQVRKEIQQAIVAEREITPAQALQSNIDPALQVAQYKTLANDVHDQIQALIETRPPIRNTPILLPCTAHWLAHQLYGDMSRADEIKHLNPSIVNFAVLQAGMGLIAYAR